jgi:hypothetical protein
VPQASQQPPRLTVVSEGPLQGKSYPLQLGNQLVGRGGDADVVIDSPNLSRRHAYLSWDGKRLEIQDAGSTNGTSVDGEWIDASRALRGGELLGLGDVVLRVDAPVSDATIQLPMPRREVQFRSEFGTNYGQGRSGPLRAAVTRRSLQPACAAAGARAYPMLRSAFPISSSVAGSSIVAGVV